MITYSIIVLEGHDRPSSNEPGETISIRAPWELVEGLARLSLSQYPSAARVIAIDETGQTRGEWRRSETANVHDAWFRAKVEEALKDDRPAHSQDEVEAYFAARRAALTGRT